MAGASAGDAAGNLHGTRLVKGGHGVFVLHVAPDPKLFEGGLCRLQNIHSFRNLCIPPMGSRTGLRETSEANQKARSTISAFGWSSLYAGSRHEDMISSAGPAHRSKKRHQKTTCLFHLAGHWHARGPAAAAQSP